MFSKVSVILSEGLSIPGPRSLPGAGMPGTRSLLGWWVVPGPFQGWVYLECMPHLKVHSLEGTPHTSYIPARSYTPWKVHPIEEINRKFYLKYRKLLRKQGCFCIALRVMPDGMSIINCLVLQMTLETK